MITEYIHYELGSSLEENSIDLTFLCKLNDGSSYYRSYAYSEIYLPNKILDVEVYLSFRDEKLEQVNYRMGIYALNYMTDFINSLASNDDECLLESPLTCYPRYFCTQNNIRVLLYEYKKGELDFTVELPK